MHTDTLALVPDGALLGDLAVLVASECSNTAMLLAHIAEVDRRGLYLGQGHPSMHAYCVHQLHLSEDGASKRIHAARKAREFPVIFEAVGDGRLHLSAVCLLAANLTPENARELVEMAKHQTSAAIRVLLARRFPKSEVFTWVHPRAISEQASASDEHAPAHVDSPTATDRETEQHAPMHAAASPRSRLEPLAADRFALQTTISGRAHELLEYAKDLLGHQAARGEVGELLEQALEEFVQKLEKQRFAVTGRPRLHARPSVNPRYIPAHVKRAVVARDQCRCTFVSPNGRRCAATNRLEFDHVLEAARGGEATVDNIRLLCRAHNQYEAERTYGAAFMRDKRQATWWTAGKARKSASAKREARRHAAEAARERQVDLERDPQRSVVPWLRGLGVRLEEARRAADACSTWRTRLWRNECERPCGSSAPRCLTIAHKGRGLALRRSPTGRLSAKSAMWRRALNLHPQACSGQTRDK